MGTFQDTWTKTSLFFDKIIRFSRTLARVAYVVGILAVAIDERLTELDEWAIVVALVVAAELFFAFLIWMNLLGVSKEHRIPGERNRQVASEKYASLSSRNRLRGKKEAFFYKQIRVQSEKVEEQGSSVRVSQSVDGYASEEQTKRANDEIRKITHSLTAVLATEYDRNSNEILVPKRISTHGVYLTIQPNYKKGECFFNSASSARGDKFKVIQVEGDEVEQSFFVSIEYETLVNYKKDGIELEISELGNKNTQYIYYSPNHLSAWIKKISEQLKA